MDPPSDKGDPHSCVHPSGKIIEVHDIGHVTGSTPIQVESLTVTQSLHPSEIVNLTLAG